MLSQRKLNSRKTLVVFSPLLYRQHRYACTLILEIFSLASPPAAGFFVMHRRNGSAGSFSHFVSPSGSLAAGRRRHFSADNKSIAGPPNQPPRKLPGGHARFVLLFLRIFHLLMQAACCAFFPARARGRPAAAVTFALKTGLTRGRILVLTHIFQMDKKCSVS